MRSVLLVDDDAALLDGMRKALRSHRDWKVETAQDARAALGLLARQPYDVVVSDSRMPGLSGEGLLQEVLQRWPMTMRVVLSGEIQTLVAQKLMGLAQQLLPKPIKPASLYALVEGALCARERLGNPALRALIGGLGPLPALPAAFTELTAVLAAPTYELADLVQVVQRDPGTAANVMKLVNSAWFGLPKPMASLRDAIRSVGANSLRTLVLTAGVFSGNSPLSEHLAREALARQTLVTALGRKQGRAAWFEAAVTAAIVCDVARLVLGQHLADASRYCESRISGGEERTSAEEACFGADHAAIGAALLGQWALPQDVVETVALHHHALPEPGAASAVELASLLVERPASSEKLAALAAAYGMTDEEARGLPGASS